MNEGHQVNGLDINPLKVEIINAGKSPVIEAGVDKLIAQAAAGSYVPADSGHAGYTRRVPRPNSPRRTG